MPVKPMDIKQQQKQTSSGCVLNDGRCNRILHIIEALAHDKKWNKQKNESQTNNYIASEDNETIITRLSGHRYHLGLPLL